MFLNKETPKQGIIDAVSAKIKVARVNLVHSHIVLRARVMNHFSYLTSAQK
jgi:hypothetical protein